MPEFIQMTVEVNKFIDDKRRNGVLVEIIEDDIFEDKNEVIRDMRIAAGEILFMFNQVWNKRKKRFEPMTKFEYAKNVSKVLIDIHKKSKENPWKYE